MSEKEILEEFKYRYINSKTNNYIFSEVDDFELINDIPDKCDVSIADNISKINCAQNIKIDLRKVKVKDIFSYVLKQLLIFDYKLELNNKLDLLRFQNILSNNSLMVQMIFYNIEELSVEEQMLFNEIYYFNSVYFNANTFIKDRNFQSYFLKDERVLDNRENYNKVKMVRRDIKVNRLKK